VKEAAALRPALERALAANREGRPAVLDVRVARERLQGTYDHYLFYGRAEG